MENNYHEKETIRLVASESKSRMDLHIFLKGRGFTSEDEFYFLDRNDAPKPWQSISVMTVNVFDRGSTVYETAEDVVEAPGVWDELQVDYLLATLPPVFIEKFANECEILAVQFNLKMEMGGRIVPPGQLQLALQAIATNLTNELDEPGSETLRILIEQSYGR